ncbi:MAG: PfkB family carbohydrate kinase [Verrucomicrobiota bacterium]
MKRVFDVLGLGCTAVDDLIYVDAYPPSDVKVRTQRRERHFGGLTGTALATASRLGARCAYAGVLGVDDCSRFVLRSLQREGINLDHVMHRTGAGPVQSFIVVDQTHKTRNIFFDVNRPIGAHPKSPSKEVILSAKVLFVDIYGMQGMIRAARIARAAGIPVVGDFERSDVPRFSELIRLVDHLILPNDFACTLAGTKHPAAAAEKLWTVYSHTRGGGSVVIVTCGGGGCYCFHQKNRRAEHWPAFKVKALDTTGCGDVFHGAYAAALASGMELEERIPFATAAAALRAARHDGQAGIPSRPAVEALLRKTK